MVTYYLELLDPFAHLFRVRCCVQLKKAGPVCFSLPDWIPGSYMIREFSRNIIALKASLDGQDISIEQTAKSRWQVDCRPGKLSLEMDYYAFDASVRSCFFDQNHAYFNGTSLFFRLQGFDENRHVLEILPPKHQQISRDWIVATSMKAVQTDSRGFGCYQAHNYADLIDHPVEIAPQTLVVFEAKGIEHRVYLQGSHNTDSKRLAQDLQTICEYELQLFGQPCPLDRFVFLVWVVEDGYGGLEHSFSTSLMVSRKDLPDENMQAPNEDYIRFLALCAHEYFHCWNVKRLKPKAFINPDLNREAYTRLLWWFEGVTSYYDEWILLRCGLIDLAAYLKLIGQTWDRVLPYQGRHRQSIAESSMNAWHKFYKQDENAQNAIVSYYTKGSMVAMALDLTLRQKSNCRVCLDDLLLFLWQQYGLPQKGLDEFVIEKILAEQFNLDLQDFFQRYIYGTDEPDYAALCQTIAIRVENKPQEGNDLGARVKNAQGLCQLERLFEQQSAMQAGLAAGDILIAFDGVRVTYENHQKLLDSYSPGSCIRVHAFRQDWLFEVELIVQAKAQAYHLLPMEPCSAEQKQAQQQWADRGKLAD